MYESEAAVLLIEIKRESLKDKGCFIPHSSVSTKDNQGNQQKSQAQKDKGWRSSFKTSKGCGVRSKREIQAKLEKPLFGQTNSA